MVGPPRYSFHLRFLIKSAKSLLPVTAIYTSVLGTRTWTALRGNYSAYYGSKQLQLQWMLTCCSPELFTKIFLHQQCKNWSTSLSTFGIKDFNLSTLFRCERFSVFLIVSNVEHLFIGILLFCIVFFFLRSKLLSYKYSLDYFSSEYLLIFLPTHIALCNLCTVSF